MISKMKEDTNQKKEQALTDQQQKETINSERESIPAYRIEKISRIAVREGETAFTGDPARPSEKCTGCMSCMAACALSREGCVSPEFSGIRIYHHTAAWVLRKAEILYSSSICRQCPGVPPCDEVCPEHAHYRDSKTGAVVIDPNICIRCKQCVDACPYNACWYSEELDKVVKCDVCHGNSEGPQCVTVCPSMILRAQPVK
jgi:Fe-S-cluster-containing dehydrogenase component